MLDVPLGVLNQIYAVCAVGGCAYLVVTMFLGMADSDSGPGDDCGAGGGDDGGAGSGDDCGAGSGTQTSTLGAGAHGVGPAFISVGSGIWHLLLSLSSPMLLAFFAVGFGAIGLMVASCAPWLGELTVLPAVGGGFASAAALKLGFRWFIRVSAVSTNAEMKQLPGSLAEVEVGIPAGRTGSVSYVVNSKRFSSSAQCRSQIEIKKGCKVVIVENKDHMVYVEPCEL